MMRMDTRLVQTQSQRLMLTQKMQQALQILQYNGQELDMHVQQELETNPVLERLEAEAAPLHGINIAAQHEHSVYLLNWLKINSVAIVEPQVGVPPGPGDLARIIEQVPRDNIKFIVHAAYEDPRPSAYVAEHAGVPLTKLPFTIGGTDDAMTFGDFYRSSVERMLDALAGNDRS